MNRQAAKDAKAGVLLEEPHRELDVRANAVIGAAIEVHRHLGPGFLESVYEHALTFELKLRGIHVEQQVSIPILYKGRPVSEAKLDLLVGGDLVVELKAVDALLPIHTAQVISYLRAGSFQLGLLINFNVALLRNGIRRIVFSG